MHLTQAWAYCVKKKIYRNKRNNISHQPASPAAARYWRILVRAAKRVFLTVLGERSRAVAISRTLMPSFLLIWKISLRFSGSLLTASCTNRCNSFSRRVFSVVLDDCGTVSSYPETALSCERRRLMYRWYWLAAIRKI